MPNTNIQNLNYSDSQNQIVNKLNNNFDEMIELHGGVQGNIGPTGGPGAIGLAGNIGPTGLSGPRGTRWFVRSSSPEGSGLYAIEGDYWVEVSTSKIYIFTDSGWVYTGYDLSNQSDLFRNISYTSAGGSAGISITENQNSPYLYTFVIGDESPEDSPLINQNLSKFVISTDNSVNDSPILEFSKSDIEDGSIADYTSHPVFNWSNTNSANQDLSLEVPGGNFNIGASGGIEVYGSSISLESATGITFDGVDYIWATGGINLNFPSGNTTISSINFETGATFTSINRAFSINPTLTSSTPSVYVDSGSTGAFKTERPTDTFDSISHSVYNVILESNGPTGETESQFFIDTKGKIKTNKVDGGITYPTSTPGATSTAGSDLVYWYLLGRTSSPNSLNPGDFRPFSLTDGNIVVVNPYTVQNYLSSFCGIGIYSDFDYSWGTTGGLERGQSIRVSTYCSQNQPTSGVYTSALSRFKYIGYGKNSSNINSVITLPFLSTSVDFIISRGATGSGTSVNYLAYGSSGGSGGSFYF